MADIFISYNREDLERVRPIAETLSALGWTVWWDRKIPPGRSFDEVIEEQLGSAKCAIVAWSERSVGSRWVRAEASAALDRGLLVPVLLQPCSIPLAFRQIHAADLSGWDGTAEHPALEELKAVIADLCGPPGKTDAAPPPKPATSPPWPEVPPPAARRPTRRIAAAVVAAVVLVAGGIYLSSRVTGPNDGASGAKATKPESAPPGTGVEAPVQVVQVFRDERGSFVSSGFATPKGQLVIYEPTEDPTTTAYWVGWTVGNLEQRAMAKVIQRNDTYAPFLALLERPAGMPQGAPTRIRVSTSLTVRESVERYLSQTDRTPGTVLETGAERNITAGKGKVRLRSALVTTSLSAIGDSGAPVIDADGRVVGVLIGGNKKESVSLAIENVRMAFRRGF